MASNVEILGIENLKFALENVEKKLRTRVVRESLKLGAKSVKKEIRKNVPLLKKNSKTKTRTRGLVKSKVSVRPSGIDKRKGDIGVFVNVRPAKGADLGAKSKKDPFYWKFINYGWSPGNRKKKNKKGKLRVVKQPAYSIRGVRFLESGAKKLPESLKIIENEFVKYIKAQDNAS